MHFNDNVGGHPANASVPGADRIDYIVCQYDSATNALTFPAVIEGVDPATTDYIVATVFADNNGGNYEASSIENSERTIDSNFIVVGDGYNTYNSEILDGDNPIQDAIDKVNARGGGIVYYLGGIRQTQRNVASPPVYPVYMRSLVTLDGANMSKLRLGPDALDILYMYGATDTGNTAGADLLNATGAPIDFWDVGIGSRVVVTGADPGTYYIKSIVSATQAQLINVDGTAPAFGGGAATFTVYITGATVRNIDIESNLGDPTITLKRTESATLQNVTLNNDAGAAATCISATIENNNTRLINVQTKASEQLGAVDYAVSMDTFGINENWVVNGCQFDSDVTVISAGAGNGIWGNNLVGGVTTIPAGFVTSDTIRLASNKLLTMGDLSAGYGYMSHDGTDLTIHPSSLAGGILWIMRAAKGVEFRLDDDKKLVLGTGLDAELFFDGSSTVLTQRVCANYYGTGAPPVIPANALTVVDFDTKDFDKPGADRVTVGGAWVFTADRDMTIRYDVSVPLTKTWNINDTAELHEFINAGDVGTVAHFEAIVASTHTHQLQASNSVELTAGQTFHIEVIQSDPGAATAVILTIVNKLANISIREIDGT